MLDMEKKAAGGNTVVTVRDASVDDSTLHGSDYTTEFSEKFDLGMQAYGGAQFLVPLDKIGLAHGSPSRDNLSCFDEFPRRQPSVRSRHEKQRTDRQAWLQVFAAFFLFMNSWGMINAFGEYQTYYKSDLLQAHSNSAISWIGSVRAFILLASPLIWGPIFDLGYLRPIVLSGTLFIVLGEFLGSFCTQLEQLIATQGILVGLGNGAFFLSAVSIVPTYFPKEKQAFAMGIAAAGSSLGGVVYPIVIFQLQPKIGFGWASRVIALIAFITSLIPCILLRMRARPNERRAIIDSGLLRDIKFDVWSVAWFLGNMGIFVPFFLIQQYAADVAGFETHHAFWTLIIMNAAATSGRILPGKIADRINDPLRVIGVTTAASTVVAFCWIAVREPSPGVFLFSAVYGFCSGAFVSLSTPATVSLAPSIEGIGTRLGMFNFIGSLGLLAGNPIAGAIAESSWFGMQIFCGSVSALAFVLICLTWWIARRH